MALFQENQELEDYCTYEQERAAIGARHMIAMRIIELEAQQYLPDLKPLK